MSASDELKTITVRVPPADYATIKRLAATNHRSINGELIFHALAAAKRAAAGGKGAP